MLCFPRQSGKLSLAHEVADAIEKQKLNLLISDVVASELRTVATRDFPKALTSVEAGLDLYGVVALLPPTEALTEQASAVCTDPDDVSIVAAAVQCKERYGVTLLLSNDIETFHTPQIKAYLATYGLAPVTLYGLLRAIGQR